MSKANMAIVRVKVLLTDLLYHYSTGIHPTSFEVSDHAING
jgi:hypothetical protein